MTAGVGLIDSEKLGELIDREEPMLVEEDQSPVLRDRHVGNSCPKAPDRDRDQRAAGREQGVGC